jgi:hypothetical protein
MDKIARKVLIVLGIMIGGVMAGLGLFVLFLLMTAEEFSRA